MDHGIPLKHVGNDYTAWCQEMGLGKEITNGVLTQKGTLISSPKGWVFGCYGRDSPKWHWCDTTDGYWYNQKLDSQNQYDNEMITELRCQLKHNIIPSCMQSKHTICI